MGAADPGADHERAIRMYQIAARGYDRSVGRWANRYRRLAIDRLWLTAGDAVLDVACGTGANFALLSERVGATGQVVGVDLSPDMLAIAGARAGELPRRNVTLIEAAVEDAQLPEGLDAALFSLTHDVLQSKAAVDNVFAHLRRGARVAAFGAKWAAPWNVPVNLYVRRISRRYVTTFEGFEAPWRHLVEHLDSLRVDEVALGGAYIASGVARGRPAGPH
jgi:ubiquinone/menaquinone biosynthesis C-methylase UbiE